MKRFKIKEERFEKVVRTNKDGEEYKFLFTIMFIIAICSLGIAIVGEVEDAKLAIIVFYVLIMILFFIFWRLNREVYWRKI